MDRPAYRLAQYYGTPSPRYWTPLPAYARGTKCQVLTLAHGTTSVVPDPLQVDLPTRALRDV
eukprot:3941139-Rhodomonas_salina.3